MIQIPLLSPVRPPDLRGRGIDVRCCSCEDEGFLRDATGADLVIADPNWLYKQAFGEKTAADHYKGEPIEVQIRRLNRFYDIGCKALALWLTEPIEAEFDLMALGSAMALDGSIDEPLKWAPHVTGGSWHKQGASDTGHYGSGWWTSGTEEPWRLYVHGLERHSPTRPRNGYTEPPTLHSRKPSRYMAQWIRCWTAPGAKIVVPFAGLGGEVEAVMLAGEGRTCLAAEIDPERYEQCMGLLAQVLA